MKENKKGMEERNGNVRGSGTIKNSGGFARLYCGNVRMIIGRYCSSACRDCRVLVCLTGDNKEICYIITPAIHTILLAK